MDKQDELAGCIWTVVAAERFGTMSTSDICERIAAAVRSFMGSNQVADRAAAAVQSQNDDNGYFSPSRLARAALSAAIGEDIGGGRG